MRSFARTSNKRCEATDKEPEQVALFAIEGPRDTLTQELPQWTARSILKRRTEGHSARPVSAVELARLKALIDEGLINCFGSVSNRKWP